MIAPRCACALLSLLIALPATGQIGPGTTPPPKPAVPPPAPATSSPGAADLPTIDSILEKALAAIGGTEGLKVLERCEIRMKHQRGNRTLESINTLMPGSLRVVEPRGDGLALEYAIHGEFAWQTIPKMKPRRVHPIYLESYADRFHHLRLVADIRTAFAGHRVLEKATFNAGACWKVEMKREAAATNFYPLGTYFAFFDTTSGRLVALQKPIDKASDTPPVVVYDQWKDFGALHAPTSVTWKRADEAMGDLVLDIKALPSDAPSLEVPAEVKAAPEPKAPVVSGRGRAGTGPANPTGSGG